MDGWYFSDETECLRYGDFRRVAVGVTHTVRCKPALCKRGLHASPHVLDALTYAHGPILWRVTLGGRIVHGDDKSCATKRTYHARLDATELLGAFARECALEVIHLWDAPPIVRHFLETGDESLRDAAWTASNASWPASSAAARAASATASNASWAASSAAARAASATASNASWAAAYAAARAASATTRDASWAVSAAANAASWPASSAAARAAQRSRLDQLVKGELDV